MIPDEEGTAGDGAVDASAGDVPLFAERLEGDPDAVRTGRLPVRVRVVIDDEPARMVPSVMEHVRHQLRAQRRRRLVRADEGTAAIVAAAQELPITVRPEPFLTSGAATYTMGSCFAVSLRDALAAQGMEVHPHSEAIAVDDDHQHIGYFRLLNHYDTFTIRQEITRVLDPDGYRWAPVRTRVPPVEAWSTPDGTCLEDPARMKVFATDEDHLADLVAKVDATTIAALDEADVVIISLGIVETWVDTATGSHVWGEQVARHALDGDRFCFHASTYEENLDNVRWVCRALAEHRPGRPVVLTVSPVSLGSTFTGQDVVVANTYGKSMLRAVAGAVEAEMDHVRYWPSYEIALHGNLFGPDLRHITDEGVAYIVERFLAAHVAT